LVGEAIFSWIFWVDLAYFLMSCLLAFYGVRGYFERRVKVFLYFGFGFVLLAFSDLLQIVFQTQVDVLAEKVLALTRLGLYAGFVFLSAVALKKIEETHD
jgi:NADH:ubiquinone oxidoreductase subunit K